MPLEDDLGLLKKTSGRESFFPAAIEEAAAPAREFIQGGLEKTPGIFRKFVAPMVLPGTLGTLGVMAGAPLAPFTAGTSVPLMGMGGASLGETLNQLLGVTEPSPTQIGVAGVTQGIGMAGGRILGLGLPRLPGTGPAAQEIAVNEARGIAPRFAPEGAYAPLFAKAESLGVKVTRPRLAEAADEILKDLRSVDAPNEGLINLVEQFRARADVPISMREFQLSLRDVGARTGLLRGLPGNAGRDASEKLFAAMMQDLNDAAATGASGGLAPGASVQEAAQTLKAARDLFRRSASVNDLGDIIKKGISEVGTGDQASFKAAGVINELNSAKNRVLRESFSKDEWGQIIDSLRNLKGLQLPTPTGQYGSGRRIGQLVAGGLAGFGASQMGLLNTPVASAVGTASGLALPYVVAAAVATPLGRGLLKGAILHGGGIVPLAAGGGLAQIAKQTGYLTFGMPE